MISLPLSQNGENRFSVKVLDEYGHEKAIGASEIVITKTLATIGAIPASHSVCVEVLEKLGGVPVLVNLVYEGDALPKKGSITFKAGQTIKAETNDSFNIKLWEGNIQSPITDNRFIGVYKIVGTDIASGVVPTGADIECEYEMSDSGTIVLGASIPCIGAFFGNRNFYCSSKQDLNDIDSLAAQGRSILERIDNISKKVDDPKLDTARRKAELAANIDSQEASDPEDVLKASNELLEAQKKINEVRQANLKTIRQMDLDSCVEFFDEAVRQFANPAEERSFDSLVRTAQRSIDRNDSDFDNILDNMRTKNTIILLRQDWFIVDWYQRATVSSANYLDQTRFFELKELGDEALVDDNIDKLRTVLFELVSIQIHSDSGDGMNDIANIVKG